MDSTVIVGLIIIAIVAFFLYLPKLINTQKVNKIIDAALAGGLSKEAITILLARDATRSLGRVLEDRELEKIRDMVDSRVNSDSIEELGHAAADVQAVFQYLNQTAAPFLLQKGERVARIIPAVGLREPRAVRTTYGTYGGPSVRVAKGVYIHGGVSRSTSSSSDKLKDIDGGDLFITNQRLFFVGKLRTVNAPFKKIVSIEPHENSIVLHKDGRERAQYFLWPSNLIKFENTSGTLEAFTGYSLQALVQHQLNS
jgi:hypothetical protein